VNENIIEGLNRRLKEIEKQIEEFDKRAAAKQKSKAKRAKMMKL
jgi:hypothetical protein